MDSLFYLQSPLMGTNENLSSSSTSPQPSSTSVYCKVCGSPATEHLHYGALVCYACRAFFRRQVIKSHLLPCAYNDICVVTKETKDRCPYCRFQKCLQAGMKPGWVMDKQDLEQKRKKASIKKNLGLKTSRSLPKTKYEQRMRWGLSWIMWIRNVNFVKNDISKMWILWENEVSEMWIL